MTTPEDRAVYVISVAAELAGMHAQTLRMYERRGLVNPSRTDGGSRRYSAFDIERLQRIQDLTNAGMNLEGVRRVIDLEDQLDQKASELQAAQAELLEMKRLYRRELVPAKEFLVPWRSR